MGKKSKILYWSCLVVNLVCFVLDLFLLDLLNLPIEIAVFRFSFPASLILIGLLLIARAVTLKLDSSLFIGIILLLLGFLNGFSYVGEITFGLDINQLWPYYLFAVSIACLVTGMYFKNKLQLKLFILFLIFGLITLLFVQKLIILGWYIALMVFVFVVYFAINIISNKKRGK